MSLAPGTRIGVFEVTAAIGQGGMGEVYRATDTNLKRSVAIKVLPESLASDHERLARFQREAEVLAALNHPHIAQIYGLERGDVATALVMELVEGVTLAERIARGPIPIDEALHAARQITSALEAAHEQGIVHRDLKPANIKVKEDGTVKVLDFGLAKALASEGASATAGDTSHAPTITSPAMTQIGVILGTAAYMSPEQARGKAVDKRADIWAFGCVLYEMVAGRRLFDGDDLTDTIAAVVRQVPDLTAAPPGVRRLLSKCLEKDPRRRLRDIGDAWDLVSDEAEAADPRAKDGRRLTRVLPWSIAAAAVIAAAAAVGGLWQRPPPPPEVMRFEIHAPAGARLPLGAPALSPDGRMLAYRVIDADGTGRIHVRPIDRVETRALPGTDGATHVFWSPDGRALAFAVGGAQQLKRIDLAGGAPRNVAVVSGSWHGTWGRNDDILFLGSESLNVVSARGGAPAPLGPGTFPTFLPDGERFLLRDENSIQLGRLGSTERTVVIPDVASAPILAPTPLGPTYILYLRERDLMAQEFDEGSGRASGREVAVVPGIGVVANPALRPAVGVSPGGTLAYQASGDDLTGQLTWFDRSGKILESLPPDLFVQGPDLSPDGSLLVGLRIAAFREVHVVELQRQARRRVPVDTRYTSGVRWSADGTRLAVGQQGQREILLVDPASGSAKPMSEVGTAGSWSPDGRYLLSSFGPGERARVVPVDGTAKPVEIGPRGVSWGRGDFSPDGRYIAFDVIESGRAEVYVQPMPPATTYTRVSVNGGVLPRWGKDGSELFFLSPEGAIMAAAIQLGPTVAASAPRELFRPGGSRVTFDVSADGQRLLVSSSTRDQSDVPITVVVNWWAELAGQR